MRNFVCYTMENQQLPPEYERLSLELVMLKEELHARRQAAARFERAQKRARNQLLLLGGLFAVALAGICITTIMLVGQYREIRELNVAMLERISENEPLPFGDSLLLPTEYGLPIPAQVLAMTSRCAKVPVKEISLLSDFREDLGLSHADYHLFILHVMQVYRYRPHSAELDKLDTVGDLIALLERQRLWLTKPATEPL